MNKAFTSDEFINLITDRDKSERFLVEESIIKDTYLEGFDMTNITFKLCSFENCNLRGADFSGSSISGTLFRECPMHRCRFVASDMTEAIFRDIRFRYDRSHLPRYRPLGQRPKRSKSVCRSPRGRQSRWHHRR